MTELVEKTWGIRFNTQSSHRRSQDGDCPDWIEARHFSTWQEEGLIVWNNFDQKIEHLQASETLRLLNQLLSDESWKTEGIPITHFVQEINIEITRRGRQKKTEPEEKSEKSSSKPYFMEFMRLPPDAGYELIDLIEKNKETITRTAEFKKRQFDQAMLQIYEWILDAHHQNEQSEIDLTARNFNWQRTSESRWTCQHQMVTGKVCLSEDKWLWCACAERLGLSTKIEKFEKLQEAIEWAETGVVDLANQPEPEAQPRPSLEQTAAERVRLQEKLRNGPFWIDPSLLETKKPTYKIFIEVDAEPNTYKTYTSFCSGQTFRTDEHYLSPAKLSTVLSLPFEHFGFEQILGENSGWHHITSLTAFYQETMVAEQAQDVWNHSRILQQFKAGQIKRARYGYQEVETGYTVFLGICEKPEAPWGAPESRQEYFAEGALRESVCFALDVDDYRAFLGLSVKDISDDDLLDGMHTVRARSKLLPENVVRESKVWLALHEPIR